MAKGVENKSDNNTNVSASNKTEKSSKQSKMFSPQVMQEQYDKITPLQKIVTLQHIYSLYMAAAQQPDKREVNFNIIQLQRMINSNPLVNPEFDFLDISGFFNKKNTSTNSNNSSGSKGKSSQSSGGLSSNTNLWKEPVSPVQLIQILTESLTLRDENIKNEQVIQQVPNKMLFRLSKYIDLNFVKDRLIKLLNAYKNSTLLEIEELENKWKSKKAEIQKIEEGKMDDGVLYEEFLKDLKKKRGDKGKRLDSVSPPTEKKEKTTVVNKEETDKESEEVTNLSSDDFGREFVELGEMADSNTTETKMRSKDISKNKEEGENDEPTLPKQNIENNSKASKSDTETINEKDIKTEIELEDVFVDASEHVNDKHFTNEGTDKLVDDKSRNSSIERSGVKEELSSAGNVVDSTISSKEEENMKEGTEELLEEASKSKKNTQQSEDVPIHNTRSSKHKLGESADGDVVSSKKMKLSRFVEEPSPDIEEEREESISSIQTRSKTNVDDKNKAEIKKFQQLSHQLLTNISSHRFASMFLNPVNANDEPMYYALIKKPVDLKTINKKVRAGSISSFEELDLEMQIMFTNAIMYNDMGQQEMYKGIMDMMKEWESLVDMVRENV